MCVYMTNHILLHLLVGFLVFYPSQYLNSLYLFSQEMVNLILYNN